MVREPITVVVSEKGWIRALRGHVSDLSGVAFKSDDELKFAFPTETTAKILIFASNGKFYTLEASKLPGGRGHGEPVRLYFDIEQDADVVATMAYQGGRKFLVASHKGNGFVVKEDDVLGTTRKGKQVLNLKAPDKAAALTPVNGELAAAIGQNRKMVIFSLDQVPEMGRGRGVRLQRYKEKGLADVTTFKAAEGLSWVDAAGRSFTLPMKELADWRGNRADAGRIAPKGFPKNNKFGSLPGNGKANGWRRLARLPRTAAIASIFPKAPPRYRRRTVSRRGGARRRPRPNCACPLRSPSRSPRRLKRCRVRRCATRRYRFPPARRCP